MKRVLLTGAAGFIGHKVAEKFLREGFEVVGLDNFDPMYPVELKRRRIEHLRKFEKFTFHEGSITDRAFVGDIFSRYEFDGVLNLAAKAGVRYSILYPRDYFDVNLYGTLNLLEAMMESGVRKIILASTSSIYAGHRPPFREDMKTDSMISPYAASKKAAENLLHVYHHLYGLDVFVLRYFTVYGPSGRPDMSVFRFIYWIMKGEPLLIYGDGSQRRSFSYVEDVAEGTFRAYTKVSGYEVINIGNDRNNSLMEMISYIEEFTGRKAKFQFREFHRADVYETHADISKARRMLGWEPKVDLREGIGRTVEWFKDNWFWIKDLRLPE